MGIVRESVSGACNLDYPNYEVIVVDNGSTDGSGEQIREYLDSKCKIKNKYIKLSRNLGFNAANNIAFRARDKDSKYIALLNNDAAPYPDSLGRLVERLESDEKLAAIQGIITNWNASSIDNVGFMVDELLYSHAIYRGYPPHAVKKSHYCTYVSGAYRLYSIKSREAVNKGE
ncbi:MAG: glycosyltransferase, partial [Desulfurococcales archaeon]|nr:glycosyltransferase [Desulfurococcales archaeon]